jgi:hypothetical protein
MPSRIIPAFAAEVQGLPQPTLTVPPGSSLAPTIHVEYGAYEWADAQRVEELLTFDALLEGFAKLRRYLSECAEPRGEFRLA